MVEQIARALLLQTSTLALASGAVRLLQLAMVRRLGAGAGYLAWLLVPVAMLAVALPHPAVDALVIRVPVVAAMPAWVAAPASVAPARGGGWIVAAVAAWAAGVLLLAALLARRQRVFEAHIDGGLPPGAGPAVVGIWRRRIVLPRDFDAAFDAEERRLMLLHEGVHLRRADNAWNLLASALLVMHWFNPVAWWAWRRLRLDQELACDAAVLRQESADALSTYTGALLKVQGLAFAPPLATSWQSTHPLVERVRMLQLHRISSARQRLGRRAVALLVLVGGFGSYALRAGASAAPEPVPGGKDSVMMSVTTEIDGQNRSPIPMRVLMRTGDKSTLRLAGDPARHTLTSEIALVATPLAGERVQINAELRYGDSLLGSPRVITRDGEPARIQVKSDNEGHVFAVTLTPRLVAAPPAPAVPGHAALPLLPAPPAAPTPAALPRLPAPPAPAALPPVPGTPAAADLPAPPAPPQRAI